MKYDKKKKQRLRDQLPVVDIAAGVKARMDGREWFRVGVFAASNNVSTSTILNHIKSGKLEGCSMCGVIHTRKPDNQGATDEGNTTTAEKAS